MFFVGTSIKWIQRLWLKTNLYMIARMLETVSSLLFFTLLHQMWKIQKYCGDVALSMLPGLRSIYWNKKRTWCELDFLEQGKELQKAEEKPDRECISNSCSKMSQEVLLLLRSWWQPGWLCCSVVGPVKWKGCGGWQVGVQSLGFLQLFSLRYFFQHSCLNKRDKLASPEAAS